MIRYAKTQPPTDEPSGTRMLLDIGEKWTGAYCELCRVQWENGPDWICPLLGATCNHNCHPVWLAVDDSTTWSEWIENAEKLLELMESL
jgi:hypothetical protein